MSLSLSLPRLRVCLCRCLCFSRSLSIFTSLSLRLSLAPSLPLPLSLSDVLSLFFLFLSLSLSRRQVAPNKMKARDKSVPNICHGERHAHTRNSVHKHVTSHTRTQLSTVTQYITTWYRYKSQCICDAVQLLSTYVTESREQIVPRAFKKIT